MKEIPAPTVRIKGFTDSWKQCKLGEMVNFSKGTGYSKSDLKESGTPIILYGRLYTKYETIISNVDTFADEKPNSVFSEGGEVIVPASGETAEDISVASVVDQPGVLLGGDLNIVKPPSNLDSTFLAISISNGKPHRDMANMAQGKSVVHLHNSDLAKIDFPYPKYKEQCRISQYFKNIDYLITLHQRKLDQQKKLKKYFLQNMFPAKGGKVPRIRFKGFTGDWEQRKLGELMEVGSVKRVHQSDWRDSGVRFLRARDIVAEYKNEQPDDYLYIDEGMYNAYSALSGKVQKGDLLVTGVGTIGVPMLIKSDKPVYFKDGNIIWFKNKNAIDGRFFYYAFISSQIQNFIKEASGTGTVGTYTIDSGKKTPIALPVNRKEQEQIGAYIGGLDHFITLHQRKLDQLQTMKKFMLQNMFI